MNKKGNPKFITLLGILIILLAVAALLDVAFGFHWQSGGNPRMATTSAMNFILIGTALICVNEK